MTAHGNGRVSEQELSRASYYALYLRFALGYSPDEAAILVKQRYPNVRIPELRVRKASA
jgi:hypothetical protein